MGVWYFPASSGIASDSVDLLAGRTPRLPDFSAGRGTDWLAVNGTVSGTAFQLRASLLLHRVFSLRSRCCSWRSTAGQLGLVFTQHTYYRLKSNAADASLIVTMSWL